MGLFSRRQPAPPLEPAPIPVPRPSIDGWTLSGSPLVTKLSKPDLRELEILLHGIAVQADTPYTYERAAVLLERAGDPAVAVSICDAWIALPAAGWPEYAHHTRAIEKRRGRLRNRQPTAAAS
jgi:hypothetical protein